MPLETIYVVAAIIKNSKNEYLITQRMPNARYGGYWEFPGGTVEKGEAPEQALARELKEELNIDVKVHELYWHESFKDQKKIIDIQFLNCEIVPVDQTIQKIEVADYRWVCRKDLNNYQFPEADEKFVQHLISK
jgi:8-oxo-dGTP diphosphatase